MSFILDALKKSERAHQRRRPLRLDDDLPLSPAPQRSRRPPRWIYIALALALLLNASLLAWWLRPWQSSSGAGKAVNSPAAAPAGAPAPAAKTAPVSKADGQGETVQKSAKRTASNEGKAATAPVPAAESGLQRGSDSPVPKIAATQRADEQAPPVAQHMKTAAGNEEKVAPAPVPTAESGLQRGSDSPAPKAAAVPRADEQARSVAMIDSSPKDDGLKLPASGETSKQQIARSTSAAHPGSDPVPASSRRADAGDTVQKKGGLSGSDSPPLTDTSAEPDKKGAEPVPLVTSAGQAPQNVGSGAEPQSAKADRESEPPARGKISQRTAGTGKAPAEASKSVDDSKSKAVARPSAPIKTDAPDQLAVASLKAAPQGKKAGRASTQPPQLTGSRELVLDLKELTGGEGKPSATTGSPRTMKYFELPSSVRNSLPTLSFSMLLFSKKPAERWININGSKLREGQEVASGLKLEEITPDGAILNFKGQRFYKAVIGD